MKNRSFYFEEKEKTIPNFIMLQFSILLVLIFHRQRGRNKQPDTDRQTRDRE